MQELGPGIVDQLVLDDRLDGHPRAGNALDDAVGLMRASQPGRRRTNSPMRGTP